MNRQPLNELHFSHIFIFPFRISGLGHDIFFSNVRFEITNVLFNGYCPHKSNKANCIALRCLILSWTTPVSDAFYLKIDSWFKHSSNFNGIHTCWITIEEDTLHLIFLLYGVLRKKLSNFLVSWSMHTCRSHNLETRVLISNYFAFSFKNGSKKWLNGSCLSRNIFIASIFILNNRRCCFHTKLQQNCQQLSYKVPKFHHFELDNEKRVNIISDGY